MNISATIQVKYPSTPEFFLRWTSWRTVLDFEGQTKNSQPLHFQIELISFFNQTWNFYHKMPRKYIQTCLRYPAVESVCNNNDKVKLDCQEDAGRICFIYSEI